MDLQLRSLEQPISRSRRTPKMPGIGNNTGAHFSREYMNQVVQEVQQALAAAGLDAAVRQAQQLLSCGVGPQQAAPEASTAETRASANIIASEHCQLHAWVFLHTQLSGSAADRACMLLVAASIV